MTHGAHSAELIVQRDSAHVQRTAQLAQRATMLMNSIANRQHLLMESAMLIVSAVLIDSALLIGRQRKVTNRFYTM